MSEPGAMNQGMNYFSVLEFRIICSVIPGRREAANPESITPDYGFRVRHLAVAPRND
jgi:hypothetical protein